MTYAINSYTGSGVVGPYNVTFPYITKAHVEVRVAGVLKAVTTDYTWPTSGTIQFVATVANGLAIEFRRNSNKSARLVDYQDASVLTEATMDQDATQLLYICQETLDLGGMALDSSNKWDATSHAIENVTNGVNPQDAVTVAQLLLAAISPQGLPLPVAVGGTGSASAAAARIALGLLIGTDVQAYDANTAKVNVAQTFTKTQLAVAASLTSGAASDFTAGQQWDVNVNGSTFTIANPSAVTAKTYIAIYVTFTTSNTLAFGANYKNIAQYAPSATAGKQDFLLFRVNGTNLELVGYALDTGKA